MIYAVSMVLVAFRPLVASWRKHVLELTLFGITVVCVLAYLVADMTTPLTLRRLAVAQALFAAVALLERLGPNKELRVPRLCRGGSS